MRLTDKNMAMISRVIGAMQILFHETQGYSGKLSRSVRTQNAISVTDNLQKTNSSLAVLAKVIAHVSYWQ